MDCVQTALGCLQVVRADPTGGLLTAFAVSALVSTGVGLISKLILKPKKTSSLPAAYPPTSNDFLTVAPKPGGPLVGVFGHRRMGGVVIFQAKSGAATYFLISIANAAVSGVNAVYVNNQLVTIDGSNRVTDSPWSQLVSGVQKYSMSIKTYDGTQVAADATLTAAFPGWDSNHIGLRTAYAWVKIDPSVDHTAFDPVYNSGVPTFTFDVTGFKCYDPRDGTQTLGTTSTYKYSSNAAIINANYLVHELGANFPGARVDWTSVTAAANTCDEAVTLLSGGSEPRYSCAVAWTTDERHEDVLARIGASHAGGLFFVGQKFLVWTGAFPTPQATVITADDYAGNSLTFAETPPLAQIVNGVRGQFADPLANYQTADYPTYQNATDYAADGSVAYWLQLDLQTVTSHTQAQRLSKIAYNKARSGFTASVELQFKHFNFVSDDVVQITDALAGFSAKTFRITDDALDESYVVTLQLEYEASSFYSWTAASDEQAHSATAALTGETGIQPPGGVLSDVVIPSATCTMLMTTLPSPSPGADTILYVITSTSGTVSGSVANGVNTTGNIGVAVGGNVSVATVQAKNSITGELSAVANVLNGTKTYAALNDVNEINSTVYALAPPAAPTLQSSFGGSAVLAITAVVVDPAPKPQNIELWTNTVNDSSTASLVSTLSNATQNVIVSGTAGQVKFYWARTKNATDSKFSPFSKPTLVVY